MQAPTAHQVADGGTWATYLLVLMGGVFAWLDTHASGLMAIAALLTAAVNWWYRRAAHKWDGAERRGPQH
ncbi:MAG: hypothetical protein UY48_C0053G0008 [Candidatus Gottesmanbacteria bacterium GW2011_GWB1_49_7]|uniref:Uncharacterized protein n=1 Tax=Candidatus Gottesmanbacteria bacterium GW2011_GWB1_49_7 TaxID=1618448 RepID=A0A0G1VTM1_9BACT|nr:MAG: hypothetical protein UY48_C0053G0008 [Candidatus Gottesmanbacteria bacterium GW2011_GWB1_49_7]